MDALKAHFSGSGLTGVLSADGGLRESAKQFYEENFWHFDDLDSQAVANKVFDLSVNVGPFKAICWLQMSVGAKPDGKFGPKTCECTNTLPTMAILSKLKLLAKSHYESLNKPEFIKGWLRRLES